jgi:hypothetical protein
VSLPLEESVSLRDFRRIVGEAYSDFQAKVPDCKPPIVHSLAALEDFTTEDSKYPNLMVPEVRMRYGM